MSVQVAVNTTNFTLSITPTVCVVDVVQDGNNQLLQSGSKDCDSQLPLLVPMQGSKATAPLFSLPFAGTGNGANPVVLPNSMYTPWSSVTSVGEDSAIVSVPPNITIATSGIIIAALVVIVSMDLALFEMRFSRKAIAWLQSLLSRKR